MTSRGKIGKYNHETQRVDWYDKETGAQEIHYIQQDSIDPVESHATDERKVFDSRSKLYNHYKEHGYEVTGGDHLTGKGLQDFKYPKTDRNEINDTVRECKQRLDWGMEPLTEKERHEWLTRRR